METLNQVIFNVAINTVSISWSKGYEPNNDCQVNFHADGNLNN